MGKREPGLSLAGSDWRLPTQDSTGPQDKEASVWGLRVSNLLGLREATFHTIIYFILEIHVFYYFLSPLLEN